MSRSLAPSYLPPEATMILQTFWTRGDLQCVLVRPNAGPLSVQVFIRGQAFITERCSMDDAGARAAKLLVILNPSDTTA